MQECLAQVSNLDALEFMKNLPDKSGVVISDPPYGVDVDGQEWDDEEHFRENVESWYSECRRIGTAVLWFAADKMLPLLLGIIGTDFKRQIVWWKDGITKALNNGFNYSHEVVLVSGKPKTISFKQVLPSVLRFPKRDRDVNHPTVKPIGLMNVLVTHFTEPGDMVYDPFCGSGTTACACISHGRQCLANDINPEYVEIAKSRCRESKSQLFTMTVQEELEFEGRS